MMINSDTHRELAAKRQEEGRPLSAGYHRTMAWLGDKINSSDSTGKGDLCDREVSQQGDGGKAGKIGGRTIHSNGSFSSGGSSSSEEFGFSDVYPEYSQNPGSENTPQTRSSPSLQAREILEVYQKTKNQDEGKSLLESAKNRLILWVRFNPSLRHTSSFISSIKACSSLKDLIGIQEDFNLSEVLAREYLAFGLLDRIEELYAELTEKGLEGSIRNFYDFYTQNKSVIQSVEGLLRNAREQFLQGKSTQLEIEQIDSRIKTEMGDLSKTEYLDHIEGWVDHIDQQLNSMIS